MPTIVYLGPAYAGKRSALEAIARDYDGELIVRAPVVEVRVDQIVAAAITGLVFEDAPRVELVKQADAVVFVADVRESRADQNVEAWENLFGYLERAGRPANTPVVIQWGHVDAADARPIIDVEQDMQIQSMIVAGELRMPNPYAMRYPERHTSRSDAFDAAARAAVNGPFEIPPDAGDFAKAMLDNQIAAKIATLAPGADKIAKDVVRGDADARKQLDDLMRDNVMNMLMERFQSDPAFQQMILDQVEEKMECSIVAPDLKCPTCKTPAPPIEISGIAGGPFGVGDKVDVDLERLSPDLDWMIRQPTAREIDWLTGTECDKCQALIWCSLTIRDGVLASVWPVSFSRATYEKAHIVNGGGMQLEAARLLGVEPDALNTKKAIVDALERL